MGFTLNVGNGLIGGATPLITEFLKTTLAVSATLAPFVGLPYPISLIVVALMVNPLLPVADKRSE
jgi:hypothetical protein